MRAHLQDTHPESVSQDFVCVVVVAVSDVSGGNKQGERILLLWVQQPALRHLLDLPHALFFMTATISVVDTTTSWIAGSTVFDSVMRSKASAVCWQHNIQSNDKQSISKHTC